MLDLDLVVPSALVEPELAKAILGTVIARENVPAWVAAVVRSDGFETIAWADDVATTPAQSWILGKRAEVAPERINIAESWAAADGLAASSGRYLLEPAHFTIARDHLRLDDPRALAITADEAATLAASIAPVLAAAGWRLDPVDRATHWFVTRDEASLAAPSIERAIGHNVATWQPRGLGDGGAALDWRRCVNEIQMLWHEHPVNEAREARGLPTVNTVWLSGNGALRSTTPNYAGVESRDPLFAKLPTGAGAPRRLETFDGFVAPARAEDWTGWREQVVMLDARINELFAAQRARQVKDVAVVLCGESQARVVRVAWTDRRRFWRAWRRPPKLDDLFAEVASP